MNVLNKQFLKCLLAVMCIFGVSDVWAKDYKIAKIKAPHILVTDQGEEIRLIGIKPFESFEQEAVDVLEWMEIKDKRLRVEFDKIPTNQDGQLLAYVYIFVCGGGCKVEAIHDQYYERLDDGMYIMLNATMLKSGLARLDLDKKNSSYNKEFRKLYWEAKVNKRGIWKRLK